MDVLDINTSITFEGDEEGDHGIARLKDKVKIRKGRGFQAERSQDDKIKGYECLKDATNSNEPGPQKSVEGWILFVTCVHEEATEEDLYDKFSDFGVIQNININLDRRTGFLKGYALIEFEHFEEANIAREAVDGTELLGQTIRVDWCFVKGPKKNLPRGLNDKKNKAGGDN